MWCPQASTAARAASTYTLSLVECVNAQVLDVNACTAVCSVREKRSLCAPACLLPLASFDPIF